MPWASFCGSLAYVGGHGTVGQQHELLNELVGILGFLEEYSCRMTFLINIKAHFHTVKFHRAVFVAFLAQNLGKAVKSQYFIGKVTLTVSITS